MRWTTMVCGIVLFAAMTTVGPGLAGEPAGAQAKTSTVQLTFDGVRPGSLPDGWKVEATNPRGPLAAWEVVTDRSASGTNHLLKVTPPPDAFGGTYNLCWTGGVRFLDGEIEVKLRAESGEEDQGGGPIWRVRDRNNYYIARYNPLESNFRVYIVKDGARKMLDSVARIRIPAGTWFTIRIVQHGDHIEGWLDGKKLLDVHDTTFTGAGGVGLWTKADAATFFDDLTVRSEAR